MDDVRRDLLHDLEGAAKMLSQALNRVHPSRNLYKAIKEVDEQLDLLREDIQDGEYDRG